MHESDVRMLQKEPAYREAKAWRQSKRVWIFLTLILVFAWVGWMLFYDLF